MYRIWKQILPESRLTRSLPFLWLKMCRRKFFAFVVVFPFLLICTCLYVNYLQQMSTISTWTPKYVNISKYNFIQNSDTICNTNESDSPLLVTIIHSARSHLAYRMKIRETWGSVISHKDLAIRTVFILGSNYEGSDIVIDHARNQTLEDKIQEESAKYGDIIISDFHDSYRNLTIKHLVGYKWVLHHCPNAAFVVKTDDDLFINPFELVNYLSAKSATSSSAEQISCHQWKDSPKRYGSDKWRITRDEYSDDVYPLFCIGAAYITTPRLIKNLYELHTEVRYFWIDDIFVTGLLRTYHNNLVISNASTAEVPVPSISIEIDDIRERYQLNEDAWASHKIFYLLKRQAGEMEFERMNFYWRNTLAHLHSNKHKRGSENICGQACRTVSFPWWYEYPFIITVAISVIFYVQF